MASEIQAISKLLDELESSNLFDVEIISLIESEFMQLLDSLTKINNYVNVDTTKKPTGKIDTRLVKVNRYIRQNFEKALTLDHLADYILCNSIYLSNTYSKIFKISPIKYLQKLKMISARERIINSEMSITEIANGLGYSSGSQFT